MQLLNRRFLLLAFLLPSVAFAQAPAGAVNGKVADKENKLPLKQASVTLIKNGKQFANQLTGEQGGFTFKALEDGQYSLGISFMGYRDTLINPLTVAGKTLELPVIGLSATAKDLKGVTVSTMQPVITQSGDKMIVNVAQSAAATGSNAFEVISKSPGVMADQDGNLKLNGKAVAIYIDGRPSYLSGEDLKTQLSGMPSSSLDKLELMSNPSTKYDAQGAAIINIKLNKPKDMGTNGTVTLGATQGRYARGNAGATLNYRNKKANIYGAYDHLYTRQFVENKSKRYFDDNYLINDVDFSKERRNTGNARIGLDYDINKQNSFGVLLKGTMADRYKTSDNRTVLGFSGQPADSGTQQNAHGDQDILNPSVNVYYKTGSEKKKSELTLNFDYFNYNKDWDDHFNSQRTNAGGVKEGIPNNIRNNSDSRIDLYSFSADFTQPTKFAKFEAGIKSTYTKTDNNTIWENQAGNVWLNDDGKTNHFIYKENVNAAYAGLNKTIKKVTFNAVLRMEHTHASGNSLTTGEEFNRDYVQLFPSASISYQKSMMNSLSFSYRRSIQRFGYEIVNPFITYKNAYTYQQGNPNIKPSISNTVEATWSYKYMLFTTLGYVHGKDNLSPTFKQDPGRKILINGYDNLGKFDVVYANVVFTKALTKKFQTTAVVTGMFINIKTDMGAGEVFEKKSVAAQINWQNTINLPKAFFLEVNAQMMTPMSAGYAAINTMGSIDLGLRKNVLKGKGTLKLGLNDILNTKQYNIDVDYQNVRSNNKINMDTRTAALTFTYRFGNKNVKQTKTRKNTIEAESNRTNVNTF
ncbi:outer membrane beta-barrel family protein [uncultured Chitinophaga sp.]|uniref:outer membrane beta-barrel family protein n=1 Tax=uncultured Chitinophaga sp. TaxID=339340 RepID=UPI0025DA62DF|nr:outer membrane beta-barrel family protein [uncultured Chitinophaga sp.]